MKKRFIRNTDYIAGMYLGGILTIFHTSVLDWKWWVVMIPTLILFKIHEQND